MYKKNVLVVVLVLTAASQPLVAEDSVTPSNTFSDSQKAVFSWVLFSNAADGISLIATGACIALSYFTIEYGISSALAVVAVATTITTVAATTSIAASCLVLDCELAKARKEALRPGSGPIIWSCISAGSITFYWVYVLAVAQYETAPGPDVWIAALVYLVGELSAVGAFFSTNAYVEMIRRREQENRPEKTGLSPDVPLQPAPRAVALSDKTDRRVYIPLLSIRY
jgi:hypothetical protein